MSQPRKEISEQLAGMIDIAEQLPETLCARHDAHMNAIRDQLEVAKVSMESLVRCTESD